MNAEATTTKSIVLDLTGVSSAEVEDNLSEILEVADSITQFVSGVMFNPTPCAGQKYFLCSDHPLVLGELLYRGLSCLHDADQREAVTALFKIE